MRRRGSGDGCVSLEARRHVCRIAPDGPVETARGGYGSGLIREHQTGRIMARGNGRESISSELHTLVGVEFTEELIHIGAEVRSNHVGESKKDSRYVVRLTMMSAGTRKRYSSEQTSCDTNERCFGSPDHERTGEKKQEG